MIYLLEIIPLIHEITDVAQKRKLKNEVEQQWLVLLAAEDHNDRPSEKIVYWTTLFAEDISVICRAYNNIVYCEWISDRNLAMACSIAQRLWDLAREVA